MKVVIEKELNIEALFDEMTMDFETYGAVDDIGLTAEAISPELLEEIFDELATEAAARVHQHRK